MIKNKDDIKEIIENELDRAQSIIMALRSIRRIHKKDGGDYARIDKNYEGCTIQPVRCGVHPEQKILQVHVATSRGQRHTYTIDLYKYVCDMNEEEIKHSALLTTNPYIQLYVFDCNEIDKAINQHIEYLEEKVVRFIESLGRVDDIINELDNILQTLDDIIEDDEMSVCYKEYVKSHI